jgi:hypothetical protein
MSTIVKTTPEIDIVAMVHSSSQEEKDFQYLLLNHVISHL